MAVSAEVAIICFVIGNGLLTLGAFFVWQLVSRRQPAWSVVATVLPIGSMVVIACLMGQVELVSGMIWGTVAFNLGLIGGLGLCFNVHLTRTKGLMVVLWLAFGWLACFFARHGETIGLFGGLGLIIVGLIAAWQIYGQKRKQIANVSEKQERMCGWQWGVWLVAIVLIGVGAWLLVWRHAVVLAVCGMPVSLGGTLVLAPVCGFTSLLGLRYRRQWQAEKVLCGLSWCNVILVTIGLGLVALITGAVHLTKSTFMVTLPWVAGLAVLSVVMTYLPAKTARWWGGLMVIAYLGLLLNLLM